MVAPTGIEPSTTALKVGRVRYEDLEAILIDDYLREKPGNVRSRKADTGSLEHTFDGGKKLDEFFKRMPVTEIRGPEIRGFIECRRKEGDAAGSSRRQLGRGGRRNGST